jgi:pyrroline-5-carboxylate reductase
VYGLSKKGIKKKDAQKYITSLFLALSKDAVINSNKDLKLTSERIANTKRTK